MQTEKNTKLFFVLFFNHTIAPYQTVCSLYHFNPLFPTTTPSSALLRLFIDCVGKFEVGLLMF